MKDKKSNKHMMNRLIDTISGIFEPIINVLMGAALLKGFLFLLVNLGWLQDSSGAYKLLYAVSDGFFYFLPVFLAYTCSKKMKTDAFTAVALAVALLYPDITKVFEAGQGLDFFGIPVRPVTYQSGVIPIILAVILLRYVEMALNKILPEVIQGFMKPLLSLAIVAPITFIVFGPLGTIIGEGLAATYGILYGFSPVLAGVIFGLIWQPMVVFGFQWGMVPIIISNIQINGMDTILPMLGPAVFGQAGAAMAVSLITKHKGMKTTSFSGSITAILGVTEPVLYGVTMPLKRPMIAACIAGAVGGGIVGSSSARAISFAFPSVVSMVVFFGEGFWTFAISCVIGFVIGFVLTLLLRFNENDIPEVATAIASSDMEDE